MFYTFLWNGKIERIKRKTLVLNYENGGLNIIDTWQFITSIKLKWLVNFIKTQTDVNWQTIPTFYFNQYGRNLLLFKMNNTNTCLRALDERFFYFTNKDFCRNLNNTQAEETYIQRVWENTFNVDPYKWKLFYTHLHKSCSDNRIKQFKYKLLHNIIATNENLHRWKIASSHLCKKVSRVAVTTE